MGDVFDYLAWRGDIPFSADPFNEVDNLLLAELAYTDFEGILSAGPAGVTALPDVSARYFGLHSEEEIRRRDSLVRLAPLLLPHLAASRRFARTQMTLYVNRVEQDLDEQFSAVTFLLEDGTAYVAFRGTDDSITGWKEDFTFSYKTCTAGQEHAAEYLSRWFRGYRRPLRVGGHSKGGNFAVYAAAFCDREVQDQITEVWSNDGPGFMEEITERPGYERILPRIKSFIPEYSVFGLLLHNRFKNTVIRSSSKGIMQHDALTWQIMGRRFVTADSISEESLFLQKMLSEWIEQLPEEQRKIFVDTVFDLVISSGAEKIEDLKKNLFSRLGDILKGMINLESEKQKILTDTLAALFRTGGDIYREKLIQEQRERLDSVKNILTDLTGKKEAE